MTPDIALTLTILAGTIALFVSNWLSVDTVALLTLLALVLTGLLTPLEALANFGNPVIVSISGILVLSAALFQTGVASRLGRLITRLAGESEWRLIVILMLCAALLSGFMNNVAVTAVLMPVIIGIAFSGGLSESRLLLPLAFAANYGGSLTLIGSPPNLIASQTLTDAGFGPFGFLEITPLGALNLTTAILFMVTLGSKLLPKRRARDRLREARLPAQLIDLYQLPERVFHLDVPASSSFVGKTLADSYLGSSYGLTVLGILRGSYHQMAPSAVTRLQAGDRLLVQGGPRRIRRAAEENGLEWGQATVSEAEILVGDVGVAEVALAPRSSLEGRTLRELNFRERFGLTVVALWRGGNSVERDISGEALRAGDAFLVQGPWRKIRLLRDDPDLLVLSEAEEIPRRTSKAVWAVAILIAMVVVVIAKLVPLEVAAVGAAVLTVITGCLRVEEARDAVDWRVAFLLTGMLALGEAMEKSGTAEWIALTVLGPVATLGPLALVAAQLLITGALTMWISSHAAAALVAPIAISVALSQGVDPRPLLMVVALGPTTALFTPFAHPAFILVMGPGGYRFRDYVRVGLPLCAGIFVTTLIGVALLYRV